jgi:lipid II isoglutaminyl synthase (glutamine-hydrolysing)
MTESTVRIGLLYPDLLGTYGDRGNAAVLHERLQRRGIAVEVVTLLADDVVPATLDCYVVGGGEDHTERAAAARLHHAPLARAWNHGAVVVAVCAGFQLLGTTVELADGGTITGAGLLDATTMAEPERRVGDVVIDSARPGLGAVCGFENHRCSTTVHGPHEPLGVNRADGRVEGVFGSRLLGTYLHGPVLVRNPALADAVLEWVVGKLPPLPDDQLATALHDARIGAFEGALR